MATITFDKVTRRYPGADKLAVDSFDLEVGGAMISAVPVLFFYAFTQRFIVEGIASVGMKE